MADIPLVVATGFGDDATDGEGYRRAAGGSGPCIHDLIARRYRSFWRAVHSRMRLG